MFQRCCWACIFPTCLAVVQRHHCALNCAAGPFRLPAGEDEREQLACIMELLGPPPRSLVEAAPRANLFFDTSEARIGWLIGRDALMFP